MISLQQYLLKLIFRGKNQLFQKQSGKLKKKKKNDCLAAAYFSP